MHAHGMSHGVKAFIIIHTFTVTGYHNYAYIEERIYGSNDHTFQVDTEANEFRSEGVRLRFYVMWR